MSITKGAMLISNANAVGTELVNQLGGTGYKPVEWADKINLLGINSVDAPYAIKSIQAGTYTGEERGAIRYSNCNAVGSMLNKKLNTDRGFKPVEWPSAIKVLKALAENTVTGDICNIQDGADTVPIKSWEVEISPTLSGKSAIECTQTGKNLISANDESKTFSANVITNYDVASLELKKGVTYTFSAYQNTAITGSTRNTLRITFDGIYTYESSGTNFHNQAGVHSMSITPSQDGIAVFAIWTHTPNEDVTYSQFMVEIGSTATTYTQYVAPTVNTVDLGRTVYGADVDVVNGEGTETWEKKVYTGADNEYWVLSKTGDIYRYYVINDNAKQPTGRGVVYSSIGQYSATSNDVGTCFTYYSSGINRVLIYYIPPQTIQTVEDFRTWLSSNNFDVVYQKATETDFTFDPITTTPETNTSMNFWNDTGSNTITYYQAPTALTRSTVSGSIASFSDADTRLTCVNAIATIPPSISGVDTVQLVDAGKNLFDKSTVTANTWIIVNSTDTESTVGYITSDYIPVKANTKYYVTAKASNRSAYYDRNKNGISYFSFSGGASFTALYDGYIRITIKNDVDLDTFIINEGDTQETYEAYNATTYTATLPSTNYGGSVDFVNGDVVKSYNNDIMTSTYLSGLNSDYIGYEASTAYFGGHASVWVRNWHYQDAKARQSGGIGAICNYFPISMHNTTIFSAQYRIYFDVDGKNISSVADFIAFVQNIEANNENLKITYELATPTTASITGQAIIPKTGTNNCYNNVGGNTEITYFTNT